MRKCDSMNDKHIKSLKFIQDLAERIEFMTFLLFEIKARTPLGRILIFLLNLTSHTEGVSDEKVALKSIPIAVFIESTGVTEEELWESLEHLQQKGIIYYGPTVMN